MARTISTISAADHPGRCERGGCRPPPGLSTGAKILVVVSLLDLGHLARLAHRPAGGHRTADRLLEHAGGVYDKWTHPQVPSKRRAPIPMVLPITHGDSRTTPKEKCPISSCRSPNARRARRKTGPAAGIVNATASPYRLVLAGVQTWSVDYVLLSKKITRRLGIQRAAQKQVTAAVKGRIDKLLVNEPGRWSRRTRSRIALIARILVVTVQNLLDSQAQRQRTTAANRQRPIDALGNRRRPDRGDTSQRKTQHQSRFVADQGARHQEVCPRRDTWRVPAYRRGDLSTSGSEGQVYEETSLSAAQSTSTGSRGRQAICSHGHDARSPMERFPGTLALSIARGSDTRTAGCASS